MTRRARILPHIERQDLGLRPGCLPLWWRLGLFPNQALHQQPQTLLALLQTLESNTFHGLHRFQPIAASLLHVLLNGLLIPLLGLRRFPSQGMLEGASMFGKYLPHKPHREKAYVRQQCRQLLHP